MIIRICEFWLRRFRLCSFIETYAKVSVNFTLEYIKYLEEGDFFSEIFLQKCNVRFSNWQTYIEFKKMSRNFFNMSVKIFYELQVIHVGKSLSSIRAYYISRYFFCKMWILQQILNAKHVQLFSSLRTCFSEGLLYSWSGYIRHPFYTMMMWLKPNLERLNIRKGFLALEK